MEKGSEHVMRFKRVGLAVALGLAPATLVAADDDATLFGLLRFMVPNGSHSQLVIPRLMGNNRK